MLNFWKKKWSKKCHLKIEVITNDYYLIQFSFQSIKLDCFIETNFEILFALCHEEREKCVWCNNNRSLHTAKLTCEYNHVLKSNQLTSIECDVLTAVVALPHPNTFNAKFHSYYYLTNSRSTDFILINQTEWQGHTDVIHS